MTESDILNAIRMAAAGRERFLVAVAGPPAAGKSTLAARLAALLPDSAVIGMDGFHLDNAVLAARGDLDRKGAPHTFDAEGFLALIGHLRQPGASAVIPVFDRSLDSVRAQGAPVESRHRILIAEGNYLLLRDNPWGRLSGLFDLTIMLNPPLPVLHSRLLARWLEQGLDLDAAQARALGNDLPNTRHVLGASREASITWDGL